MRSDKIVLFGAGHMGREYAKVLRALDVPYEVVGRSEAGTSRFKHETGEEALPGGFDAWSGERDPSGYAAIVAVNVEELAPAALALMAGGVRHILLEKPGGVNSAEIEKVYRRAEETGTRVMVAYNRRFYASTLKAQEIIEADGGVQSFLFEFTEWPHTILADISHPEVLRNWFLANSTHLVDLAFLLGGLPREMVSHTAGGTDWHPAATRFVGTGISENDALFAYHANWDAPGRFGLEVMTAQHRLIFRPIEKLHVTEHRSVRIDPVPLDDQIDLDFKPGLYRQTECFLKDTAHPNMIDIARHYRHWTQWYQKIVDPEERDEG